MGACATADGGTGLIDMTDGAPFEALAARSVLVVRRMNGMRHSYCALGLEKIET
jgi:hypothetical protein